MKYLAALVIAASLTTPAFAAGPNDGIYQYGAAPAFYSVHQNGSTMLVLSLGSMSAGGAFPFSIAGGYTVRPSSLEYWAFSIGAVSGNTARLTAPSSFFGACVVTSDIAFDGAGNASVTAVSATNTALGTSQGVNCAAVLQTVTATVGSTIALHRVF